MLARASFVFRHDYAAATMTELAGIRDVAIIVAIVVWLVEHV